LLGVWKTKVEFEEDEDEGFEASVKDMEGIGCEDRTTDKDVGSEGLGFEVGSKDREGFTVEVSVIDS